MAALSFSIYSCDDDDVEIKDENIPNEEELITTVQYTLVPNGGGDNVVFSFKDLDGDGGDAPIINTEALRANTTYTASLQFLNESEDPSENITTEINEEAAEHQVFFQTNDSNLVISYNDKDPNSMPLGLETTVKTFEKSSSNLTITLRHEPNKSAEGVKDGDITNAGGETDIEVVFPILIE